MSLAIGKISFCVGDENCVLEMPETGCRKPFDAEILAYLELVSGLLMKNRNAKKYPDVITFAFWIRKASLEELKRRFDSDETLRLGRGVVFHIAPSNVPVNFAYSLVAGLLAGNKNIVRASSKEFEQVTLISNALREALEEYPQLKDYIAIVKYERDREINDYFSSISDMRIVWGGDSTIEELRKSPIPARSGEITFADRYSLAVIDSDAYLGIGDKRRIAEDFYNDTYLSDQNACTSPRLVVWTGKRKEDAQRIFWNELYIVVKERYDLKAIQSVNKITEAYLTAMSNDGCKIHAEDDNLIVRIAVDSASADLMDHRGNSGLFFEYDCEELSEIHDFCDDKRCQTIGYIGNKEMLIPLVESGVKGVDRIVPVGKTMDFDLVWDGYNLIDMLSRIVTMK